MRPGEEGWHRRHFGVLFAKALGAERVVGVSRGADKRDEVLKMGVDEYIAKEDDGGWAMKHDKSLDLVISTLPSSKGSHYRLHQPPQDVQVGNLTTAHTQSTQSLSSCAVSNSRARASRETAEMLQLAVDKMVRRRIQQRPVSEANQAIMDMDAGKARYRYVLTN